MGRKRKYRNDAERQKAYRERKKHAKLQREALRKKELERENHRLRRCVDRAGFVAYWEIYRDRIIETKPDHYSCPCGMKQVHIAHSPDTLRTCSRCRGSIAGAVRFFERMHPKH